MILAGAINAGSCPKVQGLVRCGASCKRPSSHGNTTTFENPDLHETSTRLPKSFIPPMYQYHVVDPFINLGFRTHIEWVYMYIMLKWPS